MATRMKGMGKGLNALLGESFSLDSPTSTSTIPISQVESCNTQPRKRFDEEKLAELAESIRQHGLIQPLIVRKLGSGYHQIVAGERRWRAARMAGPQEIPVVIVEADDRMAMELAMIENLQREDLSAMEEAEGYQSLIEQYGMTQEQVSQSVGKSRSAVANALRLLSLSPLPRKLLEEEQLTAGHARALLPLSPALQEKAAETVVNSGLSVRQTEQLVKRLQSDLPTDDPPIKKKAPEINYVAEAERELSGKLGRACRIAYGKKKGRVEIEYYGVDDLNELLDKLGHLGM